MTGSDFQLLLSLEGAGDIGLAYKEKEKNIHFKNNKSLKTILQTNICRFAIFNIALVTLADIAIFRFI